MSVGCACAESVALIQPRPSIQVIRVKKKKENRQRVTTPEVMDKRTMVALKEIRRLFRSWARVGRLREAGPRLCCQLKKHCCVVLCCCCGCVCVASSEADKPGRSSSRIAPTYSKSNAANRGNRSEQEPSRYAQRTPIGGRGPRLLWLLAAEGSESTRALAPLSPLSALALALPVRLRT